MKTFFYGIFIINLFFINIFANDEFSIDNLLQDIEKKTDLSEKTKLENSGVSVIYTRDDINRRQIKNIQDILNLIYPVGYNENRYGVADPFSVGSSQPFVSSQIRVFIDNQEFTTGLYSSGLFVMSNLGIEWADHIEVYTQSPTYEFSVEPTITLIKLYTKSIAKDEGGRVLAETGSYGASKLSAYYAQEIDDWAYFAFISTYDAKRKQYDNRGSTLSRDKKLNTIVATLKKDNHNILFTTITQDRDGFLDRSLDGTPTESNVNGSYLHIGYDTNIDNFSYLIAYSSMGAVSHMEDDVTPIKTAPYYGMFPVQTVSTDIDSYVTDGEVKYNIDTINNKLMLGIKYRLKGYHYNSVIINGRVQPKPQNDQQTVSTAFLENQYSLLENSIVTLSIQYSEVRNNYSVQQDDLWMYRLANTYTNDKLIVKTIASHTQMTLDPYLINSKQFLAYPDKQYDLRETNMFLENIIYHNHQSIYEIILDYTQAKNYLRLNEQGKYETYDKDLIMEGINTRWTYNYNSYDKLYIELGYRQISHSPVIDTMKAYRSIVRSVNSYQKYDFFNEIMYYQDNIEKKDFYDYSAGIQYNYSDDITISLKGTNLLDKAKTTKYPRVDPDTFQKLTPIEISPIDKSIILTIGWTF